ncbi:hypothetical protein DOM21_17630 [Bacteriovorax stolpii]|uniref:phytanoyl-CoA dioxygenase family protein n=1 Tax=Bacteriovorax stolpii TaxID=960 RepID=UPI0011581A25|nr:phytanoyl-CoA dioxygenase family protein [Bacteriovorax stolpii]QDK43244.1 hypothetical protein DOM21_17630 [Bacteriovorax stolpii]
MLSSILTLFKAPRYVLNFPSLNKIGLQRFRIKRKLSELKTAPSYHLEGEALKVFNELEKDGIVIIKDFLSPEEFIELDSQIKTLRHKKMLKNEVGKEGGLVQWEHGNFPHGFSNLIENRFRKNHFLISIISNYTRRKFLSFPEIIYQNLSILKGDVDEEDVQTVLHVDRYFRTVKVFYTVSDYTPDNGAFWFAPGSHTMSAKRFKYEQEYSVRSSLERTGHKDQLDQNLLELGRSTIHPELRKDFVETQMCTPKNSLIIVDVSGFHKRGLISPGHSRETIRINYHYLHAPYISQWILKSIKRSPGRYLN